MSSEKWETAIATDLEGRKQVLEEKGYLQLKRRRR
jgi:hypothetical protein